MAVLTTLRVVLGLGFYGRSKFTTVTSTTVYANMKKVSQ